MCWKINWKDIFGNVFKCSYVKKEIKKKKKTHVHGNDPNFFRKTGLGKLSTLIDTPSNTLLLS